MAGKLADCAPAVVDFACLAVQSSQPASHPPPPTTAHPVFQQNPVMNQANACDQVLTSSQPATDSSLNQVIQQMAGQSDVSKGQDQASQPSGAPKKAAKGDNLSSGAPKKAAKEGAGVDSSLLPLQFVKRKSNEPPQDTITRPLVIVGDSQVGRMETHSAYLRHNVSLVSFHTLSGVSAAQAADYLHGVTLDSESVKAVVLFFGTVDFAKRNWSTVTQSITELVRILRADKNFQGDVMVVDIPPLEEVAEQVAQVNTELTSSATAGQFDVILFNEFLTAEADKISQPMQQSGLMKGIHITALAGRHLLYILHNKGYKILNSKNAQHRRNRAKAKKLAAAQTDAVSGAKDSGSGAPVPGAKDPESGAPDNSQSIKTGDSGTGTGVPGGSQQDPGAEEKMETESKEEEPKLEEQFRQFEEDFQELQNGKKSDS
ncbi:MAG: hypothetical protein GY799_21725 [Desulfobulbaceae bacterium]|nr:hypothetical protein [Desulfobulbaceae bacterium]